MLSCAFTDDQGLTHQTVKCYLMSAVRHQIFGDPHISNIAKSEQFLRGIKMVQAKKGKKTHLPITPPIMWVLKGAWLPST